jgi:hypothetical protein
MRSPSIDGINPDDSCSRFHYPAVDRGGGDFKVLQCAGTEGKFSYPPNDAARYAFWQVASFATNPNHKDCGTKRGETVLLYETALISNVQQIEFRSRKFQSILKNPNFSLSATYTLYEYVSGELKATQPLGSPNRDKHLLFPSPFNGQTLPGGVTICFEISSP